MLKDMLTILGRQLRPAFSIFIVLSVLTGLIYPSVITLAAKVLFPHQATGSLIEENGKVVGSMLIGQQISTPGHFWVGLRPPRPSRTMPRPAAAPTWPRGRGPAQGREAASGGPACG